MATATITHDFTELNDCDLTTGWTGVTPSAETGFMVEGSACCAFLIKTSGLTQTVYTISSTNLSNTHVRMWFNSILKTRLATTANGGIQIALGDGTNTGYWYVSGGDKYSGGWDVLTVDTARTPDANSGTNPTMNAITRVGFRLNLATAGVGTVPTTWVDWIVYGSGYYVSGGSDGDEIAMSHINTTDVYYGILQKIWGVNYINGELQIGDSAGTASTYFEDAGEMIVFLDEYVNSGLYLIKVAGNSTGTTVVDLSGNFITSVSRPYLVDMTDATNVSSVAINGSTIQKATEGVNLSSVVSGVGTVFDQCGAVDSGGATLTGVTIKNSDVSGTTEGSLMVNVDTEGEACTDMTFSSYTGATTYAVYVASSVTEFDMDNWQFDDPNDTTSYAVYWAGTGGTLIINALNGTNLVTSGCTSAGGTVNVVNAVNLKITVKDPYGDAIVGARVFLEAASGGSNPFLASVTITSAASVATVSHTSHGLSTGQMVNIRGAVQPEYNGAGKVITYIGVNSYSYAITGTPVSPATGTITATQCYISELTIAGGIAEQSYSAGTTQPARGWVREAELPGLYVPSPLSISDISGGINLPVQMGVDE